MAIFVSVFTLARKFDPSKRETRREQGLEGSGTTSPRRAGADVSLIFLCCIASILCCICKQLSGYRRRALLSTRILTQQTIAALENWARRAPLGQRCQLQCQ